MDYIPKVLEQVNQIRQALAIGEGKLPELPKGTLRDSTQCVLAKALSNGWNATVESTEIVFEHEALESEQLANAAKALRDLGYAAFYEPDEWDDAGYQVVLYTTPEMKKLVEDFDEELIPELILED